MLTAQLTRNVAHVAHILSFPTPPDSTTPLKVVFFLFLAMPWRAYKSVGATTLHTTMNLRLKVRCSLALGGLDLNV